MAWYDALLCFLLWRKRLQTVCANVCGFAYVSLLLRTFVYGFYVGILIFERLCMDFVHVVGILRTQTALILRMLRGFFVRIRLLCALSGFCVRTRLIFCTSCAAFAYIYGLSSWCLMRTVSRDPILCVPRFILSVRTLVIHGESWDIRSWRFLRFLLSALAARDYWTVLRIRSSGLHQFLCPREIFVIHRSILTWRFLCCSWYSNIFPRWSNITVHYAALW